MESTTVADVLKQMPPKDINHVAVYLSAQICAGLGRDSFNPNYWNSGGSEHITLALAIQIQKAWRTGVARQGVFWLVLAWHGWRGTITFRRNDNGQD